MGQFQAKLYFMQEKPQECFALLQIPSPDHWIVD